jgi:hypothetical protein
MPLRITSVIIILAICLLLCSLATAKYGDLSKSDDLKSTIPLSKWNLIVALGLSSGQNVWDFNSPFIAFQAGLHHYVGDSGTNRMGIYLTYMQSKNINKWDPFRGSIYNNSKKQTLLGFCHHIFLVPKQRICPALGYGFAIMNIRAGGIYEYCYYQEGSQNPVSDSNLVSSEERNVSVNVWRPGVLLNFILRINCNAELDLEMGIFQTIGIGGINKSVLLSQDESGGRVNSQYVQFKVPSNETIITAGLAIRL